MQGSNNLTRRKTVGYAVPLRSFLWMSLLAALTCALAPSAVAQQSTADVCRENKKVHDQYKREYEEIKLPIEVQLNMKFWRKLSSELRDAVAGGYVVSGWNDIMKRLHLDPPGDSTKQRLASQKTAFEILERALQKAEDSSLPAKGDQILDQMIRTERLMRDLKCDEVLAREQASPCNGFAGTWETSFGKMTFTITGNIAKASYDFGVDAGTVTGTLFADGQVLSGRYEEKKAKGTFRFMLSRDGQSFTGRWRKTSGPREPPSGTWEGKCIGP